MSKSVDSPLGTVNALDSADEIAQKVRKAVTDTIGEVRYDPAKQPGLANLIELLASSTSRSIDDIVASYEQYGPLKPMWPRRSSTCWRRSRHVSRNCRRTAAPSKSYLRRVLRRLPLWPQERYDVRRAAIGLLVPGTI